MAFAAKCYAQYFADDSTLFFPQHTQKQFRLCSGNNYYTTVSNMINFFTTMVRFNPLTTTVKCNCHIARTKHSIKTLSCTFG